jgi:recombination protein RecA
MKKKKSKAQALAHEISTALKLEEPIRLGSDPYFKIERITTGSLVIDRITGGGFALGRHYELYGDESSAKSFIAYSTMAHSQQRSNLCALIDPEHSFDSDWFEHLGGNPSELLLYHPQNAEDAIAVMMMLAKKADENFIEVTTIDSVASLVTSEEMAKDPREEDRIASQARMMSRALRRLTTINRKMLFLWTNQERTNVGIRFGNPRTTSGGRALRFYATGRIEMRRGTKVTARRPQPRTGKLVETEVQIGRWIQVRAEKDKSTRPYGEGAFVFSAENNEIDIASEIIMLGMEDGLITRSGNGRYSYVDLDDHEWVGTEKQFSKMLAENGALQDELITAIEATTLEDVEA